LLVTDPTVIDWISANVAWMDMHLPLGLGEISWAQIAGAVVVVVAGKWLAARVEERAKVVDLAAEEQQVK